MINYINVYIEKNGIMVKIDFDIKSVLFTESYFVRVFLKASSNCVLHL